MPNEIRGFIPAATSSAAQKKARLEWTRYREKWGTYIGLLASITTLSAPITTLILLRGDAATESGDAATANYTAMVTLCIASVLALISAGISFWLSRRNRAYAHAVAYLHQAVHHVRDSIARKDMENDKWNPAETRELLRFILDRLTICCSTVVGARCRACIKGFHEPGELSANVKELIDNSHVRVVCRDSVTEEEWHALRSKPSEAEPVRYNSPYRELLSDPARGSWLAGDMPKMHAQGLFETTSREKYAVIGGRGWSLPYRSGIVWPIRVAGSLSSADGIDNFGHNVVGFLCVDSMKKNAFRPYVDTEIGALIADLIFILFVLALPKLVLHPEAELSETDPKEAKRS